MTIVLASGVGMVLLRRPTGLLIFTLLGLDLGLILSAARRLPDRRGPDRAACYGFLLGGLAYLTTAWLPLIPLWDALRPTARALYTWNEWVNLLYVTHLLMTLLAAYAGGSLARRMASRRGV
jgi:hypothetical protein